MIASCARARSKIERRADLCNAERLELEAHVSGCAECRGYAAWIEDARAALADHVSRLPSRGHDRILARARASSSGARRRRRIALARPVLFAGAAIAAAALVALAVLPRGATSPPNPPAALAALGARPLRLSTGEAHAAGHAVVRALAPSEVRFDAATSTLHLVSGEIDVEVDPTPGRAFVVAGAAFSVHVLGTRFAVRPGGVEVTRGAVRVVLADGTIAAARLGAGETWRAPAEPSALATATAAAATEPARADVDPAAAAIELAPAEPPTSPVDGPALDAAEPLARARTAISRGRLDDAAAAIALALRRRPSRAERAEATTLRADIAVLRGDRVEAAALYLEVGRSYADLAAGDVAFYAAVRLRLRDGAPVEHRALLAEYLSAYPRGRFRPQARRRLEQTISSEAPR